MSSLVMLLHSTASQLWLLDGGDHRWRSVVCLESANPEALKLGPRTQATQHCRRSSLRTEPNGAPNTVARSVESTELATRNY